MGEFLGTIFGGIFNVAAGGGIFGILASLGTQFLKFKRASQAHKQAMEMRVQDRLDTEMAIKEATVKGSWDGLKESLRAAQITASNSHLWSNDIKNLYRPFFTTMLWVMVFLFFRDLLAAANATDMIALGKTTIAKHFTPGEVTAMIKYIVNSTAFTASAAGMWWFGDRAQAPPGFKNT